MFFKKKKNDPIEDETVAAIAYDFPTEEHPEESRQKKYVCSICGWVENDIPPQSCPICGVRGDKFKLEQS